MFLKNQDILQQSIMYAELWHKNIKYPLFQVNGDFRI